MNFSELLLNCVLRSQSDQYVFLYDLTNMYAMSHRSASFACTSRVNIQDPTFWFTESSLLAVFRVGLHRFQIPSPMSDSKSLNTSLFQVITSSTNARVYIGDLTNHSFQIIFAGWWASMNVGWQRPIAWNDSGHGPSS